MIHSEDGAKVEVKITNDGELFAFCPECRGVWEMNMNTIHKPREARPIIYGGTGINLDMGSSESAVHEKSPEDIAAAARQLFPDAFK